MSLLYSGSYYSILLAFGFSQLGAISIFQSYTFIIENSIFSLHASKLPHQITLPQQEQISYP